MADVKNKIITAESLSALHEYNTNTYETKENVEDLHSKIIQLQLDLTELQNKIIPHQPALVSINAAYVNGVILEWYKPLYLNGEVDIVDSYNIYKSPVKSTDINDYTKIATVKAEPTTMKYTYTYNFEAGAADVNYYYLVVSVSKVGMENTEIQDNVCNYDGVVSNEPL